MKWFSMTFLTVTLLRQTVPFTTENTVSCPLSKDYEMVPYDLPNCDSVETETVPFTNKSAVSCPIKIGLDKFYHLLFEKEPQTVSGGEIVLPGVVIFRDVGKQMAGEFAKELLENQVPFGFQKFRGKNGVAFTPKAGAVFYYKEIKGSSYSLGSNMTYSLFPSSKLPITLDYFYKQACKLGSPPPNIAHVSAYWGSDSKIGWHRDTPCQGDIIIFRVSGAPRYVEFRLSAKNRKEYPEIGEKVLVKILVEEGDIYKISELANKEFEHQVPKMNKKELANLVLRNGSILQEKCHDFPTISIIGRYIGEQNCPTKFYGDEQILIPYRNLEELVAARPPKSRIFQGLIPLQNNNDDIPVVDYFIGSVFNRELLYFREVHASQNCSLVSDKIGAVSIVFGKGDFF